MRDTPFLQTPPLRLNRRGFPPPSGGGVFIFAVGFEVSDHDLLSAVNSTLQHLATLTGDLTIALKNDDVIDDRELAELDGDVHQMIKCVRELQARIHATHEKRADKIVPGKPRAVG